jgi:hypothetical protein
MDSVASLQFLLCFLFCSGKFAVYVNGIITKETECQGLVNLKNKVLFLCILFPLNEKA